jgi:hypothetical protein
MLQEAEEQTVIVKRLAIVRPVLVMSVLGKAVAEADMAGLCLPQKHLSMGANRLHEVNIVVNSQRPAQKHGDSDSSLVENTAVVSALAAIAVYFLLRLRLRLPLSIQHASLVAFGVVFAVIPHHGLAMSQTEVEKEEIPTLEEKGTILLEISNPSSPL